jgi:hypothetical protein
MKKTISLVLVLVLCLGTKVANADFTFGEPVNLGPPFNTSSHDLNFFLVAQYARKRRRSVGAACQRSGNQQSLQ